MTVRDLAPRPEDDAVLAAAIAAGDEAALQELHRRYAPLVFFIACKSLDRGAAEEITQDTFLALWRKADSFDAERAAFRTWLLAIAHHRILDELRSRSRRPDRPSLTPPEALGLSAQDPLPDEQAWRQFQRASLQEALSALPEAQRRALRLAYFSELSHEAVAELLQVPLGTAKTRIRNGLRRLGERLGGLVAGLLLLLALPGAWLLHRRAQQEGRQARALDLLANSQCRTARLLPPDASSTPEAGTHASFRGLPGRSTAVLTLSRFPAPPEGLQLVLWLSSGTGWTAVPIAGPNAGGASLQILEREGLTGTWPRELRITLERGVPAAPTGPGLAAWKEGPPPG